MFTDVMDVAAVLGFDGYYASRDGHILSYWRANGLSPYRIRMDMPPKVLVGRPNEKGYLRVSLGAGRDRYIHRLVFGAFSGATPSNQVRHLDGDNQNNALSNLAEGSQVDNEKDKALHGRVPMGENHKNSKLNDGLVRDILRYHKDGVTLDAIVILIGGIVGRATVHTIISGAGWKHVRRPVA